jgi:hypothetical protein
MRLNYPVEAFFALICLTAPRKTDYAFVPVSTEIGKSERMKILLKSGVTPEGLSAAVFSVACANFFHDFGQIHWLEFGEVRSADYATRLKKQFPSWQKRVVKWLFEFKSRPTAE